MSLERSKFSSCGATGSGCYRIVIDWCGIITLWASKQDLNATLTLFPILEKTKILLKDTRRQGRTVSDRDRQESTRTLKKVPQIWANTDRRRQGATLTCFAPKRKVARSNRAVGARTVPAEVGFVSPLPFLLLIRGSSPVFYGAAVRSV